jgi:hypothetical protein
METFVATEYSTFVPTGISRHNNSSPKSGTMIPATIASEMNVSFLN